VYLALAVGLPVLALVHGSLIAFWNVNIDFSTYTLDNYRWLLTSRGNWMATRNTVFLGIVAATGATALAFFTAYLVLRTNLRGRAALNLLIMAPLGIPAVALAIAIIAAWINPPFVLYGTIWILVVHFVGNFLPFAMSSVMASMYQIGHELEESAWVSGARRLRTIARVVLPLAKPGIVASWTIVLIMVVRELTGSVFLYSPGNAPLTVVLWEMWDVGRFPRVSAVALALTLLASLLVAVAQRVGGRAPEGGGPA